MCQPTDSVAKKDIVVFTETFSAAWSDQRIIASLDTLFSIH
jgi:hypothetical protein